MARKATRTNDRRSRYTKKVIRETYTQLLEEKPAEKITVKEICEGAEINRGTFYLHYDNSQAVMHEIEDEIFEQTIDFLHKSVSDENNRQNLSNILFETLYSTKDFQHILYSNRLAEKLCKYSIDLYSELCVNTGQVTPRQAELLSVFMVNACFAVFRFWNEHGYDNLKEENRYVNTIIDAVHTVTVNPYAINEAFRKKVVEKK